MPESGSASSGNGALENVMANGTALLAMAEVALGFGNVNGVSWDDGASGPWTGAGNRFGAPD